MNHFMASGTESGQNRLSAPAPVNSRLTYMHVEPSLIVILRTSTVYADDENLVCRCSLNGEKRRSTQLRIAHENRNILNRINQQKADYSRCKLRRDWINNRRYMDQIAAYPRSWWLLRQHVRFSLCLPRGSLSHVLQNQTHRR